MKNLSPLFSCSYALRNASRESARCVIRTLVTVLLVNAPRICLADHSWTLSSPTSRLTVKIEQTDGVSYSVLLRDQEVIARPKSTSRSPIRAGSVSNRATGGNAEI